MTLPLDTVDKNGAIKSAIESALGREAWSALKGASDVAVWKEYFGETLNSYLVAARETVTVVDDDWRQEFEENIESARAGIQGAKTFDEALDVFCAALIRQSYLQLGMLPRRAGAPSDDAQSGSGKWQLDAYRTVQYVQTREQRDNHCVSQLTEGIGDDARREAQAAKRHDEPNVEPMSRVLESAQVSGLIH